jgi:hypothetical protein
VEACECTVQRREFQHKLGDARTQLTAVEAVGAAQVSQGAETRAAGSISDTAGAALIHAQTAVLWTAETRYNTLKKLRGKYDMFIYRTILAAIGAARENFVLGAEIVGDCL